jgi:hypothetical protein
MLHIQNKEVSSWFFKTKETTKELTTKKNKNMYIINALGK